MVDDSSTEDAAPPADSGGEAAGSDPDGTGEGAGGAGVSVDRRTVLGGAGLLGLLAGGAYVATRDGDGGDGGDGGATNATTAPTAGDGEASIPEDHLPFDVWTDVRDALRTSPDHLPARADALVDEGDPEAIFEFVRDDVVTLPAGSAGMGAPAETVRWGTRGTLRCGAGTPREKAALLAELYERAGYDARLVRGPTYPSTEAVQAEFLSPVDRPFAPDVGEETVAEWFERLDVDPDERSFDRVDPEGEASAALAERLRESLPDGEFSFDWYWPGPTPLVELTVDGETQYANPFFDVPFGEHGTDAESPAPVEASSDPLDVEVTLSAATADAPAEQFELVSGQWDAEDLVGRQLLVRTVPTPDPLDNPTQRLGDLTTYVPALAVQGLDEDRETLGQLSEFGDAVTIDGDRLSPGEADGEVLRNGEAFVGGGDTDPSRVATLSVDPDTSEYPTMKLGIEAKDDEGNHVGGLPGSAFAVTDEGDPVASRVRSNTPAEKIVFLYDTSGSMPEEYSGDEMQAFIETVTDDVREIDDRVEIETVSTSSSNWTNLADAMDRGANLVLYATDDDIRDGPTDERVDAIENGVPALLLSVGDDADGEVDNEQLRRMAELSGGEAIPAGDRERTREVISEYVRNSLPTTRVEYYVPEIEREQREVEVRIPEAGVSDTATYVPPGEQETLAHRDERLSGLYLTVSVGFESVTRTIAGWDPDVDAYTEVTDEQVEAVESALLGGTTLSFEGEGVTPAVAFDDLLTARLDRADVDRAVVEGDQEDVDRVREEGFATMPYELLLAQSMLPAPVDEESLTFHDGLRVALYRETPLIGTDRLRREVDVLPLGTARTAADDPAVAYDRTMDRTARVDVVEATAFDSAAATLLDDRELVGWNDLDDERQAAFEPVFSRSGIDWGDTHWLFPAEGPADALWTVDADTGAVHGVLSDGTGGGEREEEIREQLKRINRAVAAMNLYIAAGGYAGAVSAVGAVSLAVVAAFGQQLARLYAAAAMALVLMDASNLEEQVRESVARFACSVAKTITLGVFNDVAITATENILGVMGGSSPISCGGAGLHLPAPDPDPASGPGP